MVLFKIYITFALFVAENCKELQSPRWGVSTRKELMADDREAFYVVRRGEMIGVYKSLNDLQVLLQSCVIRYCLSSLLVSIF